MDIAGLSTRAGATRRRRVRRPVAGRDFSRSPLVSPAARSRDVASAVAPATVGNVAIGFDILGFWVVATGDRARLRRTRETGVRIAAVRGIAGALPLEPAKNTAGR